MDTKEQEEVRSLLSRHKSRIQYDLLNTNLLQILVLKSVITSAEEKQLNIVDENNDEASLKKENNYSPENDPELTSSLQSIKLIEIIAQNGFEKFKDFCFAIETECPELIDDLINDKIKKDPDEELAENLKENNDVLNNEKDKIVDSEEPSSSCLEYVNSHPSTATYSCESYGTTATSPCPSISPKFTHSHVNYSNYAPSKHSTSSPNNAATNNSNNNHTSSLRQKLFHRLSDAATIGRRLKKKKNSDRSCYSMSDTIEILADPVFEDDGERTSWEYHTVSVTRVPGYGFGIAVSGGRDNPHFANGDPSIAVSDVLKGGPAEDRLQVNDRIVSVNGVNLENVEYATAVQVLRDSGNTVTLVVKRRVTNSSNSLPCHQHHSQMPSVVGGVSSNLNNPTTTINPIGGQICSNSGQPIRVTLTKSNKKDDFGIVLGCRLFIKEISSKTREQLAANGYSLNEGDIITRVQNTNCNDSMSLKEAKKIIDGCKERLNLVVLRDITNQPINNNNNLNNLSSAPTNVYPHSQQGLACNNNLDEPYISGVRYSSQNLYVQPPTRGGSISSPNDEKSNLTPRGRSRGPLMDVSLSQLDRPSTPLNENINRRPDEPPRPPPPRSEDYYTCRRQLYEDDPLQRSRQSAEPRFISFQKEGSVGIRLTGGNEAGIFVTAVQPGSPASLQGLTPGDKILKVNDMDMHGVTREEAVLFLLSLQDRIDLIVQHCKEEYEEAVANQRGDSFHIKTHFHCDNPSKGEMAFKAGDVFRVIDTLHNGVVGSWQVLKIGRGHQEMQRGVIPNKSRAEELATAQFNASKKELNSSESRGNFFRRRRTHRRSKSLSKENWDDVVFSDSISKFPAYERVVLRHPGFVRPVVIFGPVADVARERLTKDFPDKFTLPLQDDDKSGSKSKIVRLSNIRDIMDRGKHALLDITPNAVDRLNYAQFYPIVLFLKADSKHVIKQLRHGLPKSAHKSSKKLFEQCQKLEKVWSHIFSSLITLNDTDSWYRKLREAIDLQQSGAVWMSESKPVESLSDDFLFPMSTSRLSYASSPESDLELSPGPSTSLSLGNLPQLVKSSSDPSIATNQENTDRDRDIGEGLPPPYTHHFEHSNPPAHNRLPSGILLENKYNYPAGTINQNHSSANTEGNIAHRVSQSIYGGMNPPDLPPRIDRASKPLSQSNSLTGGSQLNQLNNIGGPGTVNNTNRPPPQENIYGKQIIDEMQNEYIARHTDSIERTTQNSLERQRAALNVTGTPNKTAAVHPAQNGYDSVSSYESYNTTQLSVQNIRLGPNAPDDLKSVPSTTTRHQPSSATVSNTCDYRSPHEHNLRGFSGINDLNLQNSPGRPLLHDGNTNRNIDPRNPPNLQHGINVTQRPTNLNLESSPRKNILETKTDYGKYSRSNSASQADYNKSIKSHSIPSQNMAMNGGGGVGGAGGVGGGGSNVPPFKPVPPPKPKNYRAPIQTQMNINHWDNGEQSPRSPNGFFYPPTPSHFHHSQVTNSGSPHNTINNGNGPQLHGYNHSNQINQMPPPHMPASNGYKSNQHYSTHYVHRGHPSLSNLPIHSPERQAALDLAGSREQRGSAFELYRKPQVGGVGHHHNVREMESDERSYYRQYRTTQRNMQQRFGGMQMNDINEYNYRQYHHYQQQFYDIPPPLPPPLPLKQKEKKKSVLKNPIAAFKNVIMKTTRPLRRMSSMVEPERKTKKPSLRRQFSLMESKADRRKYPLYHVEDKISPVSLPEHQQYNICHEQFYSSSRNDINSTYRSLGPEDIYNPYRAECRNQQDYDDLYANRALIDLERRQAESKVGARRIVRRHSMAERTTNLNYSSRYQQQLDSYENDCEYAHRNYYDSHSLNEKRAPCSEIMARRRFKSNSDGTNEPIYRSRMEMHRNHLYQSRREMQERIAQGKREIEREFSQHSIGKSLNDRSDISSDESQIYKTKREIQSDFRMKSPTQLKDHIYQSRREAMESMAEPIYVSRRGGLKKHQEPIYETREECVISSKENITDEKKEENHEVVTEDCSLMISDSKPFDHENSNETVIENHQNTENSTIYPENIIVESSNLYNSPVEVHKTPYHISSIIKRTAPVGPPEGNNVSCTSIETQYTSRSSLSMGLPNATSTPYDSDSFFSTTVATTATSATASDSNKGVESLIIKPKNANESSSTTKGIFDETGGTLIDNVWNVSLHIPPGALPAGVKQEIYFTVTDPKLSEMVRGPPLDMENGETMLSPLVMCGPQGLEFLVPVTLNIPHCAGRTASLGLSLKATDSEKSLQTNWDNIDLPSNTAAHTVSVKVDHF